MEEIGYDQHFQPRIVSYADDCVILCRRGADRALDCHAGRDATA
jgi:hypothetical protein